MSADVFPRLSGDALLKIARVDRRIPFDPLREITKTLRGKLAVIAPSKYVAFAEQTDKHNGMEISGSSIAAASKEQKRPCQAA